MICSSLNRFVTPNLLAVFGTRFSGDFLVGSGLWADETLPDRSSIANGSHLPYTQVNLSVNHDFTHEGIKGLAVRFDVINAFDEIYQIRNGTGVGASQYGPRRGLFAGISQSF